MVKVVDTEISLDSFKREFGRKPTEPELGKLMLALAKREGQYKNPKRNMIENAKRSQDIARAVAIKRHAGKKVVVHRRGWSINKMLLAGMDKEAICDTLLIDEKEFDMNVSRYSLPREDIILKGEQQ